MYCLSKIFLLYQHIKTNSTTKPFFFFPGIIFSRNLIFLWGARCCQSLYFSYSEASCTNRHYSQSTCHQKPTLVNVIPGCRNDLYRSQQRCVARGTVFLAGKWWAAGHCELFQLTSSYCGLQSVISSLSSYWIGFKVGLFFWVFWWLGPRVSKLKSRNEKSDWRFCCAGKWKPLQGW